MTFRTFVLMGPGKENRTLCFSNGIFSMLYVSFSDLGQNREKYVGVNGLIWTNSIKKVPKRIQLSDHQWRVLVVRAITSLDMQPERFVLRGKYVDEEGAWGRDVGLAA